MAVMAAVVTYDIHDDRRRDRIHRLLLEYGQPVQESVFWIVLRPADWVRLRRRLQSMGNQRTDDVRWWPLCAACAGRAVAWCGPPLPRADAAVII
jgi:CRISPR-associated protein Cas2